MLINAIISAIELIISFSITIESYLCFNTDWDFIMQHASLYDINTLIKRIAEGDESAFQILFDRYKERFYISAFKMVQSSDQAEDIVQETFVAIWLKIDLVAEADNPEGYIYSILQNEIYAHFRKLVRERKKKLALQREPGVGDNPIEEWIIDKEKRSILENVINGLPAQQKIIYRLAKQQGLSRKEIANRLGISPNTVRNHLAAAVDYLRSWLKTNESALGWTVIILTLYS